MTAAELVAASPAHGGILWQLAGGKPVREDTDEQNAARCAPWHLCTKCYLEGFRTEEQADDAS